MRTSQGTVINLGKGKRPLPVLINGNKAIHAAAVF